MKKTILSLTLILLLTVVCCAWALAEPAVPQNAHWKENSLATAAWDAVEETDYYSVIVHAFDQGQEIGNAETGTAGTEIDVQQEINQIVGNASYDSVLVSFQVASGIYGENGSLSFGPYSQASPQMEYFFNSALDTPTNLVLDENCVLTWDAIEETKNYAVEFEYSRGENVISRRSTSIWADANSAVEGRISYDFSSNILRAYTDLVSASGEELQIRIRLKAQAANLSDKTDSEMSGYSNAIIYSRQEIPALDTPTNLVLDENCVLTWDAIEETKNYAVEFEYSRGENVISRRGTSIWADANSAVEGRISYDFSSIILQSYTDLVSASGEELQIRIRLKAQAANLSDKTDSEMSGYSNVITYSRQEIPALDTPTNLVLDEKCILTWDAIEETKNYAVEFEYSRGENVISRRSTSIWADANSAVEGRISYDFSTNILRAYTDLVSVSGEELQIRIRLKAQAANLPDKTDSEMSEYSNAITYNGHKPVAAVSLSPESPILYVDHHLFLGKTITPEDAFYSRIDWSSSDESIACVSELGRVTGVAPGTATVTAAIGDITDSVEVTVYAISSNVEDENEKAEVTDTAGSIIDDIGNNDHPDLSHTDIDPEDAENLQDQIHAGMERGDEFRIDWRWEQKDREDYAENQDNFNAIMEGGQFACGYDAGFVMYHQEGNGTQHTIGSITEFDQEIGFSFALPDLPAVQPGYDREFSLARIHGDAVEELPVTVSDGRWTAASDKFSDFVLLYRDSADETIVASGTCGTNLTWVLDDSGTLTISGTGPMTNNEYSHWGEYRGSIKAIVFPDGITTIGKKAFSDCLNLQQVKIPDGVTGIGDGAFFNCSGLMSVSIPNTVQAIGNNAFKQCGSLNSVVLPNGLISLGRDAFNLAPLRTIVIPNSLTSLPEQAISSYLEDVYFTGTLAEWNALCGSWFDQYDRLHCSYDSSGAEGTWGSNLSWTLNSSGVLSITGTGTMNDFLSDSNEAWLAHRAMIRTVEIGSGVTGIGNNAFRNCLGLSDISIPDSLSAMGENAFLDCPALLRIDIPQGVTSIKPYTFHACSGLTGISIPHSVTSIGNHAFENCSKLSVVEYSGTAEAWEEMEIGTGNAPLLSAEIHCHNLCSHSMVKTEAKAATCTEAGNSAYWTCETCHKHFSDAEGTTELEENGWIIPAQGHSMVKTEAVPATCTEAGNSAYWTCETCRKHFSDAEGTTELEENGWIIPAPGHSMVKTEAVPATCTEAGNSDYWTCETCRKHFSDAEGTRELEENGWIIPAQGHSMVKTEAVPATCTEAGNSAYWTCETCHKHFSDAEGTTELEENGWIIPAPGHSMVKTEAKAATCTEAGNSAYWHCFACGKFFSDEAGEHETEEGSWVIPASGHSWNAPEYQWADDDSCVSAIRTCKNCRYSEVETVLTKREVTSSPTEETEGSYQIVSKEFENSAFEVQTKPGLTIRALKDMNVLRLPANLEKIETGAFDGIAAEAVIIPDGCRMIEPNAFMHCEQLIYVYVPDGILLPDNSFADCPYVIIDQRQAEEGN